MEGGQRAHALSSVQLFQMRNLLCIRVCGCYFRRRGCLTEMMTNLVYIDGTVSIPPDDSGGPSVCQVELPPCSHFQNLFGICFREMRRRVFLKQLKFSSFRNLEDGKPNFPVI